MTSKMLVVGAEKQQMEASNCIGAKVVDKIRQVAQTHTTMSSLVWHSAFSPYRFSCKFGVIMLLHHADVWQAYWILSLSPSPSLSLSPSLIHLPLKIKCILSLSLSPIHTHRHIHTHTSKLADACLLSKSRSDWWASSAKGEWSSVCRQQAFLVLSRGL